jgi:hypothetical protein
MPGVQPKRDPGLDFFKPIKQRWVEHPDLLAYITCQEPFQGLKTTPAIAGLRVKLELKSKDTYRLLVRVLREESGLDLERRDRQGEATGERAAGDGPREWRDRQRAE